MMYEDDALFEKALAALDRQFNQRKFLLEATQNVTLLAGSRLPVFDNVAMMQSCLSNLGFLVSSIESWGVQNDLSQFDHSCCVQTLSTCQKLIQFLRYDEDVATDASAVRKGRDSKDMPPPKKSDSLKMRGWTPLRDNSLTTASRKRSTRTNDARTKGRPPKKMETLSEDGPANANETKPSSAAQQQQQEEYHKVARKLMKELHESGRDLDSKEWEKLEANKGH